MITFLVLNIISKDHTKSVLEMYRNVTVVALSLHLAKDHQRVKKYHHSAGCNIIPVNPCTRNYANWT